MTNDDVIRMVQGGLSDAIVLQAIDSAKEPGFDTSADGLIRLKQGKVSDAVMQKILTRGSAAPSQPTAQPAAVAPPPAAACKDCGTVESLRELNKSGQAGGIGAVAGGVVGGLLGRQIGGDRHRTAGTLAGAVGGAFAGHQIEKHAKSGKTWEIGVRFDDGRSQSFRQDTHPSLRSGDRVRVSNGVVGLH